MTNDYMIIKLGRTLCRPGSGVTRQPQNLLAVHRRSATSNTAYRRRSYNCGACTKVIDGPFINSKSYCMKQKWWHVVMAFGTKRHGRYIKAPLSIIPLGSVTFSFLSFPIALIRMYLIWSFTALSLILRCTIGQMSARSDDRTPTTPPPPDFSGEDTPYLAIPTGTDIPPGATGNVSAQNRIGTWLYGYTGCNDFPRAKGRIDGAYYDAWVKSKTDGVAEDIDWNNAAAIESLGAPRLNQGDSPRYRLF